MLIPFSFACKGTEAMGVSVVARDERSDVSVESQSVALPRTLCSQKHGAENGAAMECGVEDVECVKWSL